MYAKYKFDLVSGEDRSIPITFYYKNPQDRKREPVILTGLDFLLVARDWQSGEELARLSTNDGGIQVGYLEEFDFVEAEGDEDVTTLLVNFSHDVTEKFICPRVVFDLFVISRSGEEETRQCVLFGEITMQRGHCYG